MSLACMLQEAAGCLQQCLFFACFFNRLSHKLPCISLEPIETELYFPTDILGDALLSCSRCGNVSPLQLTDHRWHCGSDGLSVCAVSCSYSRCCYKKNIGFYYQLLLVVVLVLSAQCLGSQLLG